MRKIEVTVTTGFGGCEKSRTFEVDDDVEDEAIDEIAFEYMIDMIEWNWSETK